MCVTWLCVENEDITFKSGNFPQVTKFECDRSQLRCFDPPVVASISKSVAPDFLKAQKPSNFFVPGPGVEEKLAIMERSNFILFFLSFTKNLKNSFMTPWE